MRHVKRGICLVASIVALVLAGGPAGYADMVTVNFSGQVTNLSMIGNIGEGCAVTGSYSYDDTAVASDFLYDPTDYSIAGFHISTFTVTFGGHSTVTAGDPYMYFVCDSGASEDYYSIEDWEPTGTGVFVDDLPLSMRVSGIASHFFNGPDSIPHIPDAATMEELIHLTEGRVGSYLGFVADFDVTNLWVTPSAVPLPASALLGVWVVGLVGWRLRRKAV